MTAGCGRVVVGAGVLEEEEEEEARCTFQNTERRGARRGSVLTTSQVFSDVEALDASRVSQVARRFVAGFSVSFFSAAKKGFCSIVGLSLTVARRVTVGFYLERRLRRLGLPLGPLACPVRRSTTARDFLLDFFDRFGLLVINVPYQKSKVNIDDAQSI